MWHSFECCEPLDRSNKFGDHPTSSNSWEFLNFEALKTVLPFLRWFHSLHIDSSCEDYLTLDLYNWNASRLPVAYHFQPL